MLNATSRLTLKSPILWGLILFSLVACKTKVKRTGTILSRNDEVQFSFNSSSGDFEVRVSNSLAASVGELRYLISRAKRDQGVDCQSTGTGDWLPGSSRGTVQLVAGQTFYPLLHVGNEIWLQSSDPGAASEPFGKVSRAVLEARGEIPSEFTGEACVVTPGGGSRLAVAESLVMGGSVESVAGAWDGGADFPGPGSGGHYGLGLASKSLKSAGQGGPARSKKDLETPNPVKSDGSAEMREYVAACTAEMGPVPTLDCFGQAKVLPVTVTTENGGRPMTHEDFNNGSTQCDKPIMLQNQCAPFSRFAAFTSRAVKGPRPTQWAYFCRRYKGRPEGSRFFDDVNMIGHNPNTGATCFFNSQLNGKNGVAVAAVDADAMNPSPPSTIPNPGAPNALTFWYPPHVRGSNDSVETVDNIECARCHDNDAFLNSPFVAQAGTLPYGVYSETDRPYYAVWFSENSANNIWRPSHITADAAEACTSCHRIGSSMTCKIFADYATKPADSFYAQSLTDFGKAHPWMPPGRQDDGASVPAEIAASYEFIRACCDGKNRPECKFARVPR
jgi:hypothetical protein